MTASQCWIFSFYENKLEFSTWKVGKGQISNGSCQFPNIKYIKNIYLFYIGRIGLVFSGDR